MQIIKLNATDSTNSYLKNLFVSGETEDYTVVVANEQAKGRGQRGTKWESKAGKNLTFSLLRLFSELPTENQFVLNIATSLAVYNTLSKLLIPDLSIKWPNDILSGNFKICGILIENIVKGASIQASVIGIGLNVNQLDFGLLPNVSSLHKILGNPFLLDELLDDLLLNLKKTFDLLEEDNDRELRQSYDSKLFRKDKLSTFKIENQLVMGFIRGISAKGKLEVELESTGLREFDLKEIQLLY